MTHAADDFDAIKRAMDEIKSAEEPKPCARCHGTKIIYGPAIMGAPKMECPDCKEAQP